MALQMVDVVKAAMTDFFDQFNRQSSDLEATRKQRDSFKREVEELRQFLSQANDACKQAKKELGESRIKAESLQRSLDREIDRHRQAAAVGG